MVSYKNNKFVSSSILSIWNIEDMNITFNVFLDCLTNCFKYLIVNYLESRGRGMMMISYLCDIYEIRKFKKKR
jgi:hypothetical protein